MILDTHKEIMHLKELGFDEKKAEGIVQLHLKKEEHLATKADLNETELRLKADLNETELRLKLEIERVKIDILKWIIPILVALIVPLWFK